MFQRIKGAIDTRIAEEQARQRQATQAAAAKQPARPRPRNPHGTPSRSPAGPRDALTTEKGPDPKEFEADLAEDTDVGKQVTQDGEKPKEKSNPVGEPDPGVKTQASIDDPSTTTSTAERAPEGANASTAPAEKAPDLPADVRVKLRKLERLESKYGELLKAYRIAHARVQTIEPFETSLRENTPLTSIADPTALIEYLNQVKLKGDMVLDEFKKVSADRDDFRTKLEQSHKKTADLEAEIEDLKKNDSKTSNHTEIAVASNGENTSTDRGVTSPPLNEKEDQERDGSVKSPVSVASRIPSISMFSPKFGGKKDEPKEVAEDLFSYDSELPRLEAELAERTTEVEELRNQLVSCKGDLKVARESTEGMVQTLENTTHELNTLRETKDKLESSKAELEKRIGDLETRKSSEADQTNTLQQQIHDLQEQNGNLNTVSVQLKDQIQRLEAAESTLKSQLEFHKNSAEIVNQKLSQKDDIVKDLEDSLAMAKKSEREQTQQDETSEKKLATMRNIMESVRNELTSAENTVLSLKQELQVKQDEFAKKPSTRVFGFLDAKAAANVSTLETHEDAINYLAANFDLQRTSSGQVNHNSAVAPTNISEPSAAGKKKNKKKKKSGKGLQETTDNLESDMPIKVSEDLTELVEDDAASKVQDKTTIADLEREISQLKEELADKSSAIDRLNQKLKDEEALREEIETLRDDLLHQGQEHVEARDSLKTALDERNALQDKMDILEKDLMDAHNQITSHAKSQIAHKEQSDQFSELQSKFGSLETDYKAAESLATARFKDIADLKDLLAKAQPELRNLRSEVADLKSIKEDLKNKQGEFSRLESKHEDLKSEMKGLSKRLGDKDSETKILQEKIEQESRARSRVEGDLTTKQSELRVAEQRRTELQEQSNQITRDLTKAREDLSTLRGKSRELEEQVSVHIREISSLREELSLKTALHTSSQSLVQSLRDQTHELSTQAREASARAESLEEELAEAQRMLSERTREGQTMRMLLNQAETGTESRLREMKERMEVAIEERDRIEDETSVSSRRMMREMEDAKTKARDAQRQLKILEDEKDDLETKTREWRKRREDLDRAAEASIKEVEDVRAAMKGLREALDESERQIREAETQKTELRRQSDEAVERVEKLTRANKNLTEEIKNLQHGATRKGSLRPAGPTGFDSGVQSSRTSLDSASARPATPSRGISRSDTPTNNSSANVGLSQGTVDYVYLKNVLLQFMERKDKSHQRQLIPVLGMLLHFDQKDEQKWLSAISTR